MRFLNEIEPGFSQVFYFFILQIEFDYIESTYVAFMRGQDTFDEYEKTLADVLSKFKQHSK